MDINVYNLHFVTGLFGKPKDVHYFKNVGYNGIDTSGIVIMEYPDFIATCTGAKIVQVLILYIYKGIREH